MNQSRPALLAAFLLGSFLTSSIVAAQTLTTPDGELDLAAIERELEEAEAEAAKYGEGLLKTMVDMRIVTLKAAAAMAHLKMSQDPSSNYDKPVNAPMGVDAKPPVEIALACGFIETDKPENTQFLLRPHRATIESVDSLKEIPFQKSEFTYAFVYDYIYKGESQQTECIIERHTLKYICFRPGAGGQRRGIVPCAVVKGEPLPSSGSHVIECSKPKSKPSEAYRVDFGSGIAIDKSGSAWSAKSVGFAHILFTKASEKEGMTEYCAVDRYTKKYGCDLQPDNYEVYLESPEYLLMGSGGELCHALSPKI